MTGHESEVERRWAAEKRDFVADRRDELAAQRDAVDDARDVTAAARESLLDESEEALASHAAKLGLRFDGGVGAGGSDRRIAGRQADKRRERLRTDRDAAGRARDEATARRLAATPTTGLAAAFATIAQHLYAADSFEEVLERIAETAVQTVGGCQMATITLRTQGAHQTAATTDPVASAVDQAQYDAGEGPCLDAVEAPLVYAQSFPDARWPALGAYPTDLGTQSAASFSLTSACVSSTGVEGALNTYSSEQEAYSDEAQNIGLILAAHASTAAGAVRERAALQDLADNLDQALLSRDVIGQAKGILMERLKITAEDAFDLLRLTSNRLNKKLRLLATTLAETGELNPPG